MYKVYTIMFIFALFLTFCGTFTAQIITDKVNGYNTRAMDIINTDINK